MPDQEARGPAQGAAPRARARTRRTAQEAPAGVSPPDQVGIAVSTDLPAPEADGLSDAVLAADQAIAPSVGAPPTRRRRRTPAADTALLPSSDGVEPTTVGKAPVSRKRSVRSGTLPTTDPPLVPSPASPAGAAGEPALLTADSPPSVLPLQDDPSTGDPAEPPTEATPAPTRRARRAARARARRARRRSANGQVSVTTVDGLPLGARTVPGGPTERAEGAVAPRPEHPAPTGQSSAKKPSRTTARGSRHGAPLAPGGVRPVEDDSAESEPDAPPQLSPPNGRAPYRSDRRRGADGRAEPRGGLYRGSGTRAGPPDQQPRPQAPWHRPDRPSSAPYNVREAEPQRRGPIVDPRRRPAPGEPPDRTMRGGRGAQAMGKIAELARERGYGFLVDGAGRKRFFHRSHVIGGAFDMLREGQTVRFQPQEDVKGLRAVDVQPAVSGSGRATDRGRPYERTGAAGRSAPRGTARGGSTLGTWRSSLSPFRGEPPSAPPRRRR